MDAPAPPSTPATTAAAATPSCASCTFWNFDKNSLRTQAEGEAPLPPRDLAQIGTCHRRLDMDSFSQISQPIMRSYDSCGEHVPHAARPVHLPANCHLCAHWDHASVARVIQARPNLMRALSGTGQCKARAPRRGKTDIFDGHKFPRTPRDFWCGDGKKAALLSEAALLAARLDAILNADAEAAARLASMTGTPPAPPR